MNLSPERVFRPVGHDLVRLKSVDSTNNYAMASVHAGMASHGTVFTAFEQTFGKGQRHKKWTSSPGQNITLSIVLEPVFLLPMEHFALSSCIALACYDFLEKFVPEGLSIKWPNDLYWNDRKAGGILIESIMKGNEWLHAVAGIGININQVRFPAMSPRPVSLRQITGRSMDLDALIPSLCESVETKFTELRESGSKELFSRYNRVLFKRGSRVKLSSGGKIFETTLVEVTPAGQLVCEDAGRRSFDFGEVVWVI
jgi:BirA family biotin operon repressor/biotin-[acetyl-CoA-carboxylase] ligase